MLVNLTPHPLHFYAPDCADRVDPAAVEPLFTVAPDGRTARVAEDTLGTWFRDCFDSQTPAESTTTVSVEGVDYGSVYGLPPLDTEATDVNLPPRVYYVVALVVALAARHRPDLLVPYREVRNLDGTVIGCRQLARPV